MARFNPAKHSLANRFRPPPPEILIGTPKSRIRPNPPPFNHLIFSNRYKKPPSPPLLSCNISFAFPSPAKVAIRRRMALPKRPAARDPLLGFFDPARVGVPPRRRTGVLWVAVELVLSRGNCDIRRSGNIGPSRFVPPDGVCRETPVELAYCGTISFISEAHP